MKRLAIVGLVVFAGCAHTPGHSQGTPDPSQADYLMREGARSTMTSTQNPFLAAACYATAVNNRADGLAANASRIDANDRWRVMVWEANRPERPIGLVNVAPAGTGSSAEVYLRGRGGVEGFRRFLAERC